MSKNKTKKMKRPKFTVGPVKVRATRGPKDDGSWYWRAVVYRDAAEHTLWSGWATRDQAEADLAGRVAAGDTEPKDKAATEALPRTIGDLMECWMYAEEQRHDIKPKTKQVKHRLMSRWFLTEVARVLRPGALFRLKSDFRPNIDRVVRCLDYDEDGAPLADLPLSITGTSDDVVRNGAPWPDDIETNYQSKFRRKGLPVYAIELTRRGAAKPSRP